MKPETLGERIMGLSKRLDYDPGQAQCLRIAEFLLLLHDYNQKVNLVGTKDIEQMADKHALDALSVACEIDRLKAARYVDIGSGGGLPGFIVALALPQLKVTLVDSIGKKCKFLDLAVESFALSRRVEVINGRAEEMGQIKQYREKYDVGTARAVGTLKLTLELVVPLLKVQGHFIGQKTRNRLEDELIEARELSSALKLMTRQKKDFENVPGLEDNLLLTMQKTALTPRLFPRRWKEIQED